MKNANEHQKRDVEAVYSRFSEQELLVSHGVLIPPAEEDGLQPSDHARLSSKGINCMGPELRDELDDGVRAVDDACMRSVVDCEVERFGLGTFVGVATRGCLSCIDQIKKRVRGGR